MRRNNSTGYNGVSYCKRTGKYVAYGCIRSKRIWIGTFDDVHDAGVAASDWRLSHADELREANVELRMDRSVKSKAAWQRISPEERRRIAKQGKDTMGAAERSRAAREGNAKLTYEEHVAKGKLAASKIPMEVKQDYARKANAGLTAAQRSDAAKRGWETRRRVAA